MGFKRFSAPNGPVCNVPSEARVILEGGVPSGVRGLPRA